MLFKFCIYQDHQSTFATGLISAICAAFRTCDCSDLAKYPFSRIYDVTDKLDEPFLNLFGNMLKINKELELMDISTKRLLENIAFMLDHHVRFVNIQE
ncbi:MAG: hypothetical protein CNLJKLNK_01360 [Holosporales bacterium]